MSASVSSLSEALDALDLKENCTLEELKISYKKHALRTHPDKNPGNEDATAQFQRVGEAFKIIENHIKRSKSGAEGGFWYTPGAFDPFEEVDEEGFEDSFYDEFSDSDEYEYNYGDDSDSDEELRRIFMEFLYETIVDEREHRKRRTGGTKKREPTTEEYKARFKCAMQDQWNAEARQKAEAAARKESKAREREQERLEAQRRQKAKAAKKKAQAEAHRKKAEETVRAQHKRTQSLRSAVFAAARAGDSRKVKSGIWEDAVDAAGGEIQYEHFAPVKPDDVLETLLHIAAKKGDVDLFKWLDAHSAEMDERDSDGYTPLHLAISNGCVPIVKYVFDAYPPGEPEHKKIYETPACSNLLLLAIRSGEPELVWMILENTLFDSPDLSSGWTLANQICHAPKGTDKVKNDKLADILRLLMPYSNMSSNNDQKSATSTETMHDREEFQTQTKRQSFKKGLREREYVSGSEKTGNDYLRNQSNSERGRRFQGPGRGRGRGRAWGRGHSRGGGRGSGQRQAYPS